MEKINVAELLRNCPRGMELDCTIWDNVTFECVDDREEFSIIIRLSDGCKEAVTDYGCYSDNDGAKCVIFPKGKTTWEGFQRPFKDGDIIYNRLQKKICIYYLCEDEVPRINGCRYNESNTQLQFEKLEYPIPIAIQDYRFATEEEKQRLFDSIKAHGYIWYPEAKILEKLVETKFKVGDKIVDIFRKHAGASGSQGVISEITDDKYIFTDGSYIYIRSQDNWKLVRDKFDIDSLVPFESRVLARDNEREKWHPAFWGFYDANSDYPYKLIGCIARYCIPYEGNEHLRGKVGDCDKYFKTWE